MIWSLVINARSFMLEGGLKLIASMVLATIIFACSVSDSGQVESLGTLQETLQIGTEDAPEDAPDLFGYISEICVDDAGNIYVADGRAQEIRVFDEQGNHSHTFGRSGEGPGEFGAITALMVDRQGRIVVGDQRNARISIFDSAGTFLESYSSPVPDGVTQISEMPDGNFLLVGLHNDYLVHISTPKFDELLTHLVPVSEIRYTEEEIESVWWLPRQPGHAVALAENRILYAPAIFGGELFLYEREDRDSWTRARIIDAYSLEQPPITVSENDEDAPFREPGGTTLDFESLTTGLHALPDGGAIHMFSRVTSDGIEFLAGRISTDGTCEGYFTPELPAVENHMSLWTYAIDLDDNIYIGDLDVYPRVRRMRMSLEH